MKALIIRLGLMIILLLGSGTHAHSNAVKASHILSISSSAGSASLLWKERGLKVLLVALGLGGIYLVYHMRLNQIKKEESLKAEFSRQLADLEMKVLKAQMNPHFIFNSLNSINWYILKSETEKASLYLNKFSKLMRLILDNSNQKIISLHQELAALKLYLEMEALRFNEKFTYSFSIDRDLNPLSVGVPPMIIQPFVENAIWQGLLHKEVEGKIEIQVNRMTGGLKYVITDNGIGRKKSSELKSKAADEDKASGMKVNSDRLALLNRESNITSVETIDLETASGEPIGTQVIIKMLSAEIEPEF
ncbi:MAG: histidine kinase [Cyclobacteriaceae bacterium]|nr:histidine kinase [Cyclobacteriaceae bacterium]